MRISDWSSDVCSSDLIGVSAGQDSVRVWKTTKGKTTLLAGKALTAESGDIRLHMDVQDGHLLSFSVELNGNRDTLATGIDASPYVPRGMGFRVGLVAKGDPSGHVNFKKFADRKSTRLNSSH